MADKRHENAKGEVTKEGNEGEGTTKQDITNEGMVFEIPKETGKFASLTYYPSNYNEAIISMPLDYTNNVFDSWDRKILYSPETGRSKEGLRAKAKPRKPLGRTRSKMSMIKIGKPLDYSYRDASDLMDLARWKPRSVRTGSVPSRAQDGKYLTASIWVSYNELRDTVGLAGFVHKLLLVPEALTLLDLSFNQIRDISPEITQFTNLRVLYLHANRIESYVEVAKLRTLEGLRSLTLKGNPIECKIDYRYFIISTISQLQSFDFSKITKGERSEGKK